MGLEVGRVDHHGLLFAMLSGQACDDLRDDTFLAPRLPTAEESLVRAIGSRRIAPPQPIAVDEDNPARKTLIIDPMLAARLRKERFQTYNLHVGQPQKITHVIAPFQRREARGTAEINAT